MIVKTSAICASSNRTLTVDKESFYEGREYYSSLDCRKWDRKSRGYAPFEFLSTLKWRLKNTELVNKIWRSICDDVLSLGLNVETIECIPSSNLAKVEKILERMPWSTKNVSTSKVLVDGREYVWISVHSK